MERQRDATKAYEAAVQEADRKGMALAQGLTSGLERAAFSTGTLTEKVVRLGEELARVLLRTFALEPLAQALGAGISSFFAPAAPSGPATGPGGLAVGGGVPSQLHQGGVVGRDGVPRLVDPSMFIGARRHHAGGPVLGPGEVPIIAMRGETVVPRGAGAAPVVNLTVVNQASGAMAETRERRRPDGGKDVMSCSETRFPARSSVVTTTAPRALAGASARRRRGTDAARSDPRVPEAARPA
jgi:hypothetical protein